MLGAGGNGTDSIFFSPWLKHWEYCRKQRCSLHHLFQDFMDVLFSKPFMMVPPVPVFSSSAFSVSDHDRMGTFLQYANHKCHKCYRAPKVSPLPVRGRYFRAILREFNAPSTRIRIFLNPQLFLSGYENIRVHTLCDHSVFMSNSPVHTYSNSLRIHWGLTKLQHQALFHPGLTQNRRGRHCFPTRLSFSAGRFVR